MTASWYFREFKPGDNVSDPDFARALFSRDAEGTLARSLVREAIQNSLDARTGPRQRVRVRFALRTGRMAASPSAAQEFLAGIWPHIDGEKTGLSSPPSVRAPIPFLVVEDFGTKGLAGDSDHWDAFGAERNAFFLFFRALGRSGKEGEDRGRWGVGKFVFPLASAANCWFGLTVTADRAEGRLMGRMVLKTHRASGQTFHPDGHWGLRTAGSALVVPESASRSIGGFRSLFGVQRRAEPGLSIVVPWVSDEIDEAAIRDAVVAEYFLPILRGELTVDIDANGSTQTIDASKLTELAESVASMHQRVQLVLAKHAASWPESDIVQLPVASHDASWTDEMIPQDAKAALLARLDEGQAVAVRVRVIIRPKNQDAVRSHFDVFLVRFDGLGRCRPLIVREGITLIEDKTTIVQDTVALVVVEDRPLATLVGDAETPAHTELQYQLIKDKYVLAGKMLELLRGAAAGIIRSLQNASREDDPLLLSQFFPLFDPIEAKRGLRPDPAKRGVQPEISDPPSGRAARLRVTRIKGGFSVAGASQSEAPPDEVVIRAAYDVRRGNPFKKHQALDFSFNEGSLEIEVRGAEVRATEDNRLVIHPIEAGFHVSMVGFDENRDLVVRADGYDEDGR